MPNWVVFDEPALAAGFTCVPNAFFRLRLAPGPKLLYICLLRHAWQDDQTFPSQDTLSQDVNASRKAVNDWMRQLEEAGLISRQRREGRPSLIRFCSLSRLLPTCHSALHGT